MDTSASAASFSTRNPHTIQRSDTTLLLRFLLGGAVDAATARRDAFEVDLHHRTFGEQPLHRRSRRSVGPPVTGLRPDVPGGEVLATS